MAITYKLCGGDGSGLVEDGNGKLVVAYAAGDDFSVRVWGVNPARQQTTDYRTGWYTAWRVTIGDGAQNYGGVAKSATDWSGGNTAVRTYSSGTLSTKTATVEVLLQLMAWDGTNEGTTANSIGYGVEFGRIVGGVFETGLTKSGNFDNNTTSPDIVVPLQPNQGHIRLLATYDFVQQTWS